VNRRYSVELANFSGICCQNAGTEVD